MWKLSQGPLLEYCFMRSKRIYFIGDLAGNYIRFLPNPGFRFGSFQWSLKWGRR